MFWRFLVMVVAEYVHLIRVFKLLLPAAIDCGPCKIENRVVHDFFRVWFCIEVVLCWLFGGGAILSPLQIPK